MPCDYYAHLQNGMFHWGIIIPGLQGYRGGGGFFKFVQKMCRKRLFSPYMLKRNNGMSTRRKKLFCVGNENKIVC